MNPQLRQLMAAYQYLKKRHPKEYAHEFAGNKFIILQLKRKMIQGTFHSYLGWKKIVEVDA